MADILTPTPAISTAASAPWHFHASYLLIIGVIILGGWVGVHTWLTEHDARLQAESVARVAQAQIQTLQQAITARNQQTAVAIAPIVKIIHDTVTVPQAIAALPQVVNQPLPVPVIPQPNNAVLIPEPDVLPLFTQVADDKICRQLLTTANTNLADETSIAAQKDLEIGALKRKPKFWSRVKSTLKVVGVGVGIGFVLAKYI